MIEFLDEYKKLCLKHGVFLDACGCCNSPWVTKVDPTEDNELETHFKHLERELDT